MTWVTQCAETWVTLLRSLQHPGEGWLVNCCSLRCSPIMTNGAGCIGADSSCGQEIATRGLIQPAKVSPMSWHRSVTHVMAPCQKRALPKAENFITPANLCRRDTGRAKADSSCRRAFAPQFPNRLRQERRRNWTRRRRYSQSNDHRLGFRGFQRGRDRCPTARVRDLPPAIAF